MLDIKKEVDYKKLNAKQQENFNYHHIAAALAKYGYNSMRLNDDWEGADFIAVKVGSDMIKVQLKGRFTILHKYKGKDIYIAYRENGENRIYKHDEAYKHVPEQTKKTKSWGDGYAWPKTPECFKKIIHIL